MSNSQKPLNKQTKQNKDREKQVQFLSSNQKFVLEKKKGENRYRSSVDAQSELDEAECRSRLAVNELGLDLRHRHVWEIARLEVVGGGGRSRFFAPLPPGLVFLVVDDVVKVVGDVDPSLTSLDEAEESAISGNYEEKEKREDGDEVWHCFGERTVRRKGRGGCKWCGCKYLVDNILMNLFSLFQIMSILVILTSHSNYILLFTKHYYIAFKINRTALSEVQFTKHLAAF